MKSNAKSKSSSDRVVSTFVNNVLWRLDVERVLVILKNYLTIIDFCRISVLTGFGWIIIDVLFSYYIYFLSESSYLDVHLNFHGLNYLTIHPMEPLIFSAIEPWDFLECLS